VLFTATLPLNEFVICEPTFTPTPANVHVALGSVIVAVTASVGVIVVDPLVAPARTNDAISSS